MKRGNTNAKRKPLAVAVEPVVRQFEVVGAGRVQLSDHAGRRCGQAVGVSFEVSWTKYGMCGGVMDRSEMRKLRDYLNELLDVDHKPNPTVDPRPTGEGENE